MSNNRPQEWGRALSTRLVGFPDLQEAAAVCPGPMCSKIDRAVGKVSPLISVRPKTRWSFEAVNFSDYQRLLAAAERGDDLPEERPIKVVNFEEYDELYDDLQSIKTDRGHCVETLEECRDALENIRGFALATVDTIKDLTAQLAMEKKAMDALLALLESKRADLQGRPDFDTNYYVHGATDVIAEVQRAADLLERA